MTGRDGPSSQGVVQFGHVGAHLTARGDRVRLPRRAPPVTVEHRRVGAGGGQGGIERFEPATHLCRTSGQFGDLCAWAPGRVGCGQRGDQSDDRMRAHAFHAIKRMFGCQREVLEHPQRTREQQTGQPTQPTTHFKSLFDHHIAATRTARARTESSSPAQSGGHAIAGEGTRPPSPRAVTRVPEVARLLGCRAVRPDGDRRCTERADEVAVARDRDLHPRREPAECHVDEAARVDRAVGLADRRSGGRERHRRHRWDRRRRGARRQLVERRRCRGVVEEVGSDVGVDRSCPGDHRSVLVEHREW